MSLPGVKDAFTLVAAAVTVGWSTYQAVQATSDGHAALSAGATAAGYTLLASFYHLYAETPNGAGVKEAFGRITAIEQGFAEHEGASVAAPAPALSAESAAQARALYKAWSRMAKPSPPPAPPAPTVHPLDPLRSP